MSAIFKREYLELLKMCHFLCREKKKNFNDDKASGSYLSMAPQHEKVKRSVEVTINEKAVDIKNSVISGNHIIKSLAITSTAESVVLHVNAALVYSIHSPFYFIRSRNGFLRQINPRRMR